jgi:hypothetical protein
MIHSGKITGYWLPLGALARVCVSVEEVELDRDYSEYDQDRAQI